MNGSCTTLQTNVGLSWIEIRLGLSTLKLGLHLLTFVDFIATWLHLPHQKNYVNTFLSNKANHYFVFPNIGIQIYDIHQSILIVLFSNTYILGMSCLLESRTLSQHTLLDIVDLKDTISAGEIISCVGQKCIFR